MTKYKNTSKIGLKISTVSTVRRLELCAVCYEVLERLEGTLGGSKCALFPPQSRLTIKNPVSTTTAPVSDELLTVHGEVVKKSTMTAIGIVRESPTVATVGLVSSIDRAHR